MLVLLLTATGVLAQSDTALENANPNASFLRCATREPSDEEVGAHRGIHEVPNEHRPGRYLHGGQDTRMDAQFTVYRFGK